MANDTVPQTAPGRGRGHNLVNRIGQQCGRLTVIARVGTNGWSPTWLCRCVCGNHKVVSSNSLRTASTRSCGCLRRNNSGMRRHGEGGDGKHTREYRAWQAAKQRCTNPATPYFHRYGGRGITMCDEWLDDYTAFLRDMGRCPPGLTLDRINNDGNYEPSNCRWSTIAEQANNTSCNQRVTLNGQSYTITQLANQAGINANVLQQRLFKMRWDLSRALTEPVRQRHGPESTDMTIRRRFMQGRTVEQLYREFGRRVVISALGIDH